MADSLPAPRLDVVGLLLAAGAGSRLWPLTLERPKPLVPVGDRTLLDWADGRLAPLVGERVVNVHHGRAALLAALDGRATGAVTDDGGVEPWPPGATVTEPMATEPMASEPFAPHRSAADAGRLLVSIEDREALGTAGAVGRLRPWLAGRSVLVVNTDSWCAVAPDDPAPLADLLDGWDGERVRVLIHGADELGPGVGVVASLLPGTWAARLAPVPSGLWEVCWRDELAAGRLDSVRFTGGFLDSGTPAAYLAANERARRLLLGDRPGAPDASLVGSGARVDGVARASVVGAGARVDGEVHRSVVWPGAEVAAGERLVDAVRTTGGRTVLVR